jgi:hypothetical protein
MRILIQHHKHGEAMYDATTREQLYKAALYILFNNNDCEFYYDGEEPDPLDFDPATIEAMPATLRAAATRAAQQYERDLRQYTHDHAFYTDVQSAIAEKNGALAWQLLRSRSSYEYERVELEEVAEAPAI